MAEFFHVKKHQSFNKTIRMPDDLIEQLEKLSASQHISFNRLVVQCCQYALEHLPKNIK